MLRGILQRCSRRVPEELVNKLRQGKTLVHPKPNNSLKWEVERMGDVVVLENYDPERVASFNGPHNNNPVTRILLEKCGWLRPKQYKVTSADVSYQSGHMLNRGLIVAREKIGKIKAAQTVRSFLEGLNA